MHQNQIVCSDS